VTLSDKLFYWVFQNHPDRAGDLLPDDSLSCAW
jgi:hypothetical protein